MTSDRTKLAKDILDVLVEFLPYGSVGKKLVKLPLIYGLGRLDQRTSVKTVENIAEHIAAALEAVPVQFLDNPGSATSAASDVVAIVRRSNLSPDLLIRFDLDAEQLLSHLMSHAQPAMNGASAERRGFIGRGLKEFAYSLISHAPQLPGVDVAFMSAVLKARHGPPTKA